ncbi:MAG: hypothetical protein F4023_12130 [Acidobacteria bacterium]|nr:hypothetical protein [Acidobacteriota bacterium]MYK80389.1 hypothetical protein [Acidobacteriota bacterium]
MKKQALRGVFDVDGRRVPGILTLNGRKSKFELWSDEFFSVGKGAVLGTTTEAKGVSVLDCLPTPASEAVLARGRSAHRANIRFQLAIVGDGKRLQAEDESIVAIRFEFDEMKRVARLGLHALYGFVRDPDPRIVDSLKRYKPEYATEIESPSAIIYFGKDPTVLPRTPVEIGTVSVTRGLEGRLSGDVALSDKASVTVEFQHPVTVHVALSHMRTLRSFFTLVIGHLPTVQVAEIATAWNAPENGVRRPEFNLQVYSTVERVLRKEYLRHRMSGRCLLDCANQERTVELATVMHAWFRKNTDPKIRDANWQFFDCFRRSFYSSDRIVAAANTFDLLPKSDWPHPRLKDLKKKVRAKADVLLGEIGRADLPRLYEVTDHAIDCRNHYVHGKASKLNYEDAGVFIFLTDTLEFVYGVSQLIECDWNSECLRGMHSADHPFARYLDSYGERLSASGI